MGKDQAMGGGRQPEARWAKVGSPPDTRRYCAPKFAGGGLFGRGQQSRETRQRNVILSQYLPYSAPTFQ
jgi:hypothetical protein